MNKTKKKSSKRNITQKKTAASKNKEQKIDAQIKPHIFEEIFSILFIGISFIVLFSLYTEKMGAIGNIINSIMLGFMGISAYICPFLLMSSSVWYLIKKPNNKKILRNTLLLSLLFLIISSAFHIWFAKINLSFDSFFDEFKYFYATASFKSGGVFGFLFGELLLMLFGDIGSNIVLLICLMISVILLTEVSFFKYFAAMLKSIKTFIEDRKRSAKHANSERLRKDKLNDYTRNVDEDITINLHNEAESIVFDDTKKQDNIETQEADKDVKIEIFETMPKAISANEAIINEKSDSEDDYIFPPYELLAVPVQNQNSESKSQMLETAKKLEETLASFSVSAKVTQINQGPAVTRYELSPNKGVKVSRIVSLADDIALNLAASGIRIEAPIPGKSAVGIEVPNKEVQTVLFREVVESDEFLSKKSNISVGLGKDISGTPIIANIAEMPHLLIAGATGSGKSVCINTIVSSILYKASPKEVKLLMIDPKVVELSIYNGIPHLMIPVVTDPQKASGALNWAVVEMLKRYKNFAKYNVRDIEGYNKAKKNEEDDEFLCQIVIIIDELSDLMMAAPREVEDSICRLAQMARASGIHLIIATQRPTVDVITGTIKANIPSRLAFAVSSGTDSRTILDMTGAEKLLGKGDMLFYPTGMIKPIRVQGAFISDKEVEKIVKFIKKDQEVSYDESMIEEITSVTKETEMSGDSDEHLLSAIAFVIEKEKASISMIQRQFRVGYNRAANIVEEMETMGAIGPEDGSKPRKVLWTVSELEGLHKSINQ